jgi:hypothetical protein
MLNSPVLNLVILLSFIYFVGSLVISTINEGIASIFRMRPEQLKKALENLFFDRDWNSFLQNKLIVNPHIESLMYAQGKYPSYIPAKNFALAIISEIGADNINIQGLQVAINNAAIPADLKKVLTDFAAAGEHNLSDFNKNIENFYNNAMDRVTGVYKKKIRLISWITGLLLAAFLNIDTLKIAKDELANTQMLSKTVDNIAAQISQVKLDSGSVSIKTKDGQISVARDQTVQVKKDTAKKNARIDTMAGSLSNSVKQARALTLYLQQNSGYNLAYENCQDFTKQWFSSFGVFFFKLIGLVITAFALQLSSSFWFDLINKAVSIRSAGKKPETAKKD